MHYSEAEKKLQNLFESKNYILLIKQGKKYEKNKDLIYTCSNGSSIYIEYPGYKAKIVENEKIIYDYKVEISTSCFKGTLSHANIIVDIYNKCFQGFDIKLLKQMLIRVLKEGIIDLNQYSEVKSYSCCQVDEEILRCAMNTHKTLGKSYNSNANQFEFTFEELFSSIFWIALQEDINYPMPNYQGRKMSFSRYLETLHCFESNHTLDEVISRALVKGHSPIDWVDMDYSFRDFIN